MARIIQTVAAAGAPTSSGLTQAQVLALIQANSEWEYLGVTNLSAEVTTVTSTFDNSVYRGLKVVILGGTSTANTWGSPAFRFTNSSGTDYTDATNSYSGFKWSNPTSGYTSGNSAAYIYMPSSSLFAGPNSGTLIEYEMNLVKADNTVAHLRAFFGMSGLGGYWGCEGEGLYNNNTSNVSGVSFFPGQSNLNGAKIMRFGRRSR